MPDLFTRQRPRLRSGLLVLLLASVALAVPFVQPTAVLGADNPRQRGSGAVDNALLVRLRSGVGAYDVAQVLARARATELGRAEESRIRIVSVPTIERELARRILLADPRVESVEDDPIASAAVTPSDPHWPQQWNARRVRATEAWDVTKGASGVTIAIVDTGVDGNHPDLRGRMVRGWDFHNNDSNPYDDDGHGTAVATTAAAAGNDRVGIAGMCWRCRVMPIKVLSSNGHGTQSNVAAGVRWAVDHGADVINMSIASATSTLLLADAVAYAIRKGVIVVAAAGNSGTSRRMYPAAFPGVISVAATNETDRLYSWSSRGSWVTLAAPGCSFGGRPRARWAWLCGTSLAAPMVAGTVGLMKSVAPQMGRARLTSMLIGNTQRLAAGLAHGRLDAARSIRTVQANVASQEPTPTPTPPDPPDGAYDWAGSLGPADRWDREKFWVRGHVTVTVDWRGTNQLSIWVVNPAGKVIAHRQGEQIRFGLDVSAGEFTFTVQQTEADEVRYQVHIAYGAQ